MRHIITLLFINCFIVSVHAQVTISGTVLDKSKRNFVEKVHVISTGGKQALTDSLGYYSISATDQDSIYFYYANKPTQKYPVRTISNPGSFDISIQMNIPGKYSMLKEVTVYGKSHTQDSLENREDYGDIFAYKKPGISSSMVPGGVPGANIDELINIFRFNRNKRLKSFQKRLQLQEQDSYVNYRFNKKTVKRITGLSDQSLDSFMIMYRPSYEFAAASDEVTFDQYILNASYLFKKGLHSDALKQE